MGNTIIVRDPYTLEDLMRRFQVSGGTIKLWVKLRKIPQPLPFSKKLRWEAVAFDTWLVEQGRVHGN